MRIGERPNLTLWLYREAEYIQQYSPALLPPCPCNSNPAVDTCEITARPTEPAQPDAAARPEEPCDPPRAQPIVADTDVAGQLSVDSPDHPASESTDAPLAPAWAPGGWTGNLLDVFA